jgi:two-component system NarL family sensor kinase
MDHNAELNGSPNSAGPSEASGAEVMLEQLPLFETNSSGPSPQTATCTNSAAGGASDAIGQEWLSNGGAELCHHYIEHRLMAQEYEGLRMGRELHDSTGQLLLSLRLSIAHLREVGNADPPEAILDEINETVRQIDHEIRAFSYLHYPVELQKDGLIPALNRLARGFGERANLKITFKAVINHDSIAGTIATALLRIAQEALMNVHRHAHASEVHMSLIEKDGWLKLSVRDNGQGISPLDSRPAFNGVGLHGMRHRVELLGGHFLISKLKQGTRILATVPIRH